MRNPTTVAVGLGLVGAVVATVLGFLTFGAQATVAPDHLPLAVTVPAGAPPELGMAADRISSQGGDAVEWQVTDPARARVLLDDKEIYGILELNPGPALTIVTSGAVNPQGAQVAQQVLTGAAQGLSAALAQQGVQVTPPRVETVHAATTAARTAPLAASALLWIGGLAAAMAFGLLVVKPGGRTRTGARMALVASVSVFATGAVAGLLKLWDSSLNLSVDVLCYMLLTAVAFASVQGALLRLLHIRAAAILGPLYLLAPAVAGTVPEMLNPTYRTLLWSWTPFRFSTEGIRSLLQGVPDAPDVRTGIGVLASMAVAGLVVMAWPGRRQRDEVPVESRELVSSGS